jgi:hypothetical protein
MSAVLCLAAFAVGLFVGVVGVVVSVCVNDPLE